MTTVRLECDCGQLQGEARHVSAQNGNRVVCYCDDCQAFPRHLGKAASVLDAWGGTDLYQMPQAWFAITKGADQIRCLRLTENGIYRWYAGCCNTPIGNTAGPRWPFIGVIHSIMRHDNSRDADLGQSRGNVWTQFAKAGAPESISKAPSSVWLLLRLMRLMLVWKVRGLHQPSVFFSAAGKPVTKPEVLST